MATRLAALGVVALCVLALALAAAGLSAPSSDSAGSGAGAGTGSGSGAPVIPSGAQEPQLPLLSVPFVQALVGAVLVASLLVMVVYRGRVFVGGTLAWVLIGLTFLVFAALALLAGGPTAMPGNESAANLTPGAQEGGEGGVATGGEAGRTSRFTFPGAVFGVVGIALLAAILALVSASGSVDESDSSGGEDGDGSVEEPVGEAAGRAADAIARTDEAALPNAVYEAWYEMTTALDVEDPATATPGEFATAARDAGLDPDAVGDLTAVFEAVRYGGEPAAAHERRALEALRRIERDAVDGPTAVDRSPGAPDVGGDPE